MQEAKPGCAAVLPALDVLIGSTMHCIYSLEVSLLSG